MYELGLRHTTGKLTIQLGERGRLPFDVAVIRTILFTRTENGLIQARRNLTASIAAALGAGGDPVAATRVWFETSATDTPTLQVSQPEGSDDDELGFLEKQAEMSEGLNSLTLNLEAMTAVFHEINSFTHDASAQITNANASGSDAGARVYITNSLASKLAEPASRLEVLVGDYRQSVDRMNPGMVYVLESTAERSTDTEVASFRARVAEFLRQIDETWPALQGFRASLLMTGEATRALRKVNRRIAAALDRTAEAKPIFNRWKELL